MPAEKVKETGGRGIFVVRVVENTAAFTARIEANDVILSVDGRPLTKAEELQQYIAQKKVGERIILEILRNSNTLRLTVPLGAAPEEP